jgi:predicted ATP-dependent Lon-type protease
MRIALKRLDILVAGPDFSIPLSVLPAQAARWPGFDAGAKRLLLPMASVTDIPTIPGELFAKFQTGFYADPGFKALGVG